MHWFALFIPLFLTGLAFFIFRKALVWWELIIPTALTAIVIAIMANSMKNSRTSDTEYLSEHVTYARYFEDWNERVPCRHPKYCTRVVTYTYSCGTAKSPRTCTGTRTETYQCGWEHPYDVDYHPEYWAKFTNCGHKYHISQSYYNSLVKLYGNEKFVDMHRDYHTNDGDAYETRWKGEFDKVLAMSWEHTYENKPQAADNIFKFDELDSIQKIGLYRYPKVSKQRTQDACLGCDKASNERLRKWNGLIGRKKQVKIFLLVFKDKTVEIAERQRQYWKGGNKNELVICVDSEGNWARTFSWCDDKTVEANASLIVEDGKLNAQKIEELVTEVKKSWKRKKFKDFDYIDIPLTDTQMYWIFGISLLITIGTLAFGVLNNFTHDNPDGSSYNHYNNFRVGRRNGWKL